MTPFDEIYTIDPLHCLLHCALVMLAIYKHCEYHSFVTLQVEPASQLRHPLQPLPPHLEERQTSPLDSCQHSTYWPYLGATHPLAVGAAVVADVFEEEVVRTEEVVVRTEVLVVTAEVDVSNVVAFDVVEDAREVVVPGEDPLPEHPTRLDEMAMSSYQKVLAAEPYDSQPKYTPDILGTNLLLVQPLALGLLTPGPTVRPEIRAPLSQASMVPSVPRWYSRHCHDPAGRSTDVAIPCGERSGRVASLSWRFHIRMLDMPPNRRCWFTPDSAASGMTMNVTWSEVRAFEDCLDGNISQLRFRSIGLLSHWASRCPLSLSSVSALWTYALDCLVQEASTYNQVRT